MSQPFHEPFDPSQDYFAALGVHFGAPEEQVKKAYRRLARRFHPDVSKVFDAKQKFQEVAAAYEVLIRHRDAYCEHYLALQKQQHAQSHSVSREKSEAASNSSNRKQTRSHYGDQPHSENRSHFGQEGQDRHYQDTSFHDKHSAESRSHSKGSQSSQQSAYDEKSFDGHVHRPIDGKDRLVEYPLTLRFAIRQLKLGSFFLPGLKVRMKFTRQAFEGKTFRIAGRGYKGLYGGKDGDYLVKFKISLDAQRYKLRDNHLYARFFLAESSFVEGAFVDLDTPMGPVRFQIPEGFSHKQFYCIPKMGLPADEKNSATDLYIMLRPLAEMKNNA